MTKETKRIRGHYENLPNGKTLPSVTHVIQETLANDGLRYWYGKVGLSEARKISSEAASFGSAMHKIVAEFLRGNEPDKTSWTEQMRNCWEVWRDWFGSQKTIFSWADSKVEQIIFNDDYAGTCDWLTGAALFDWKFSNSLYESNRIQMGAYAHLVGAEKGYIVRVSKKEKNLEALEMGKHELVEAYEVFRHLLAVFNWKKKKG